ncbi:hypothetical protein FACS1894109_13620 [Spirochaetia bacterium]|nr:hypothetical protein FACS1894109_13620 [Spirochaetia bacterium]
MKKVILIVGILGIFLTGCTTARRQVKNDYIDVLYSLKSQSKEPLVIEVIDHELDKVNEAAANDLEDDISGPLGIYRKTTDIPQGLNTITGRHNNIGLIPTNPVSISDVNEKDLWKSLETAKRNFIRNAHTATVKDHWGTAAAIVFPIVASFASLFLTASLTGGW